MRTSKRILSLLLALLLCVSLLPAEISAAEPEPVEEAGEEYPAGSSGTVPPVSQVNPIYAEDPELAGETAALLYGNSQAEGTAALLGSAPTYSSVSKAGVYMREQMKSRPAVIRFKLQVKKSPNDQQRYFDLVDVAFAHTGVPDEGDYLTKHYYNWNAEANWRSNSKGYLITYTYYFTWNTTAAQEAAVDSAVDRLLSELFPTGSCSEYETVSTIYNWVTSHVTYDSTSAGLLKHSAYAALVNRTAVCQGYALLMYRLLLERGVDCRYISGTANGGSHGWNIVHVGSEYWNLDATWDAGAASFRYFLKGTEDFPDHTPREEYLTDEFEAEFPIAVRTCVSTRCLHSYRGSTVASTCVKPGYTTYTCSGCQISYVENSTTYGPHSYAASEVVAPTCTTKGYTRYVCRLCSASYDGNETAMVPHSYAVDTIVAPTCLAEGYTVYVCEDCGATETGAYTAAIPHQFDENHVCTLCGNPCDHSGAQELERLEPGTATSGRETLRYCPECGLFADPGCTVPVESTADAELPAWEEMDILSARVTLSKQNYSWSGSSRKPVPTVVFNGRTLKKDRDYTVSYSANKNAGTAKVILRGRGSYHGEKTVYFYIAPKSLAKAKLTLGYTSCTYSGQERKPSVKVKLGSVTLKKDRDYTVSYGVSDGDTTGPGEVLVTVTGIGNYTGELTKTYRIKPHKPTGLSTLYYGGTVLLTWNAVPEAEYYEVWRGGKLLGTVKTAGVWDKTVTKGSTYCYKVYAVAAEGSVKSSVSSTKKVTCKN